MKIMAIDTSGPNCSVAVMEEQKVIAHFNLSIEQTHSETLLPIIDEVFHFSKLELKEMDLLACCVGPGSFTGIRIGIATIKGFALSLNKPVISVSSLESLAYNIPYFQGMICSMLNAHHNNVYSALYNNKDTLTQIGDYYADSIDQLFTKINQFDEKVLFVGDGSIAYQDKIQQALSQKAIFVPASFNEPSAISIARIALDKVKRGAIENANELHPLYLRKSQAERLSEEN